jgi:hypothetical protein
VFVVQIDVPEWDEKHLRFGQPRPGERAGGDADLPIGASGSCDQAPTRAPIDGYMPADRVDGSRPNVETKR